MRITCFDKVNAISDPPLPAATGKLEKLQTADHITIHFVEKHPLLRGTVFMPQMGARQRVTFRIYISLMPWHTEDVVLLSASHWHNSWQRCKTGGIQRYDYIYICGDDDGIQACMVELGVPLSKETGFHQYDVYGDDLVAHPVTPLASLHHVDVVEPIFHGMSRVRALQHLFKPVTA
ncbi:hypothetical protein DKX38_024595 [Salix brachista]|uniref:Uncharacterized protein n=1 Tax=Salix brachista TaxID=2182728 RepID=A0A5N5JNM0_9ROSI|nr:hypothetical protein DKX38_024595 [Salix brachista]